MILNDKQNKTKKNKSVVIAEKQNVLAQQIDGDVMSVANATIYNATIAEKQNVLAQQIDGDVMSVANATALKSKSMLHMFEEPVISGTAGSGAIFFAGCNLRCGYCQNYEISHLTKEMAQKCDRLDSQMLADEMLCLQKSGAHNINLVTAVLYVKTVAKAIQIAKTQGLSVPIIYNTSGYEKLENIQKLEGLVDVYLPDYKYASSEISGLLSGAPDYSQVATVAIEQMLKQVGQVKIENGLIKKGVIIRHLVLPGFKQNSIDCINHIAKNFDGARVSIMSQYTPQFNRTNITSLNRKVTSYEYNAVVELADKIGLKGYMQNRSSAQTNFTPKF